VGRHADDHNTAFISHSRPLVSEKSKKSYLFSQDANGRNTSTCAPDDLSLMNPLSKLEEYLSAYGRLVSQPDIRAKIDRLSKVITDAQLRGNKLLLAGNGASAAISSHLATDFSKQALIRAMSFNDASLITAFGNDLGYESWIAKAVEVYADAGDILILISSSGRSPNVISAAKTAKALGLTVIAFTGFDHSNPLGALGDMNFWVESHAYNIVECIHMIWLTATCDLIIASKHDGSVA